MMKHITYGCYGKEKKLISREEAIELVGEDAVLEVEDEQEKTEIMFSFNPHTLDPFDLDLIELNLYIELENSKYGYLGAFAYESCKIVENYEDQEEVIEELKEINFEIEGYLLI